MKSQIQKNRKRNLPLAKKLLTLVMAVVPALFFGQAAFEKFETNNDFTTVTINKKAFSMLSQINTDQTAKDAEQIKELAAKIDLFKVVTTEKSSPGADLKKVTDSYIKSSRLEELMQVKDKGATVKIFVKSGATDSKISEILILAEEVKNAKAQVAMLLVKGNFDLEELEKLSEKVLPKAANADIDRKLSNVRDALVLKVYPNPASEVFYINTDAVADVNIYDLSGRLVKTQKYSAEGISTVGLAPATYMVEINTEGRRQTEHIVIK